MSTLQECPLCSTVLYRVEPVDGSIVAYDQTSGNVVPIPQDVLDSYESASVRVGTTYACPNGFPISYRATLHPTGPRSSRVVAKHVAGNAG